MFYVFQNILTNYKSKLERLSETTNILIFDYTKKCKNTTLVFNCAIFVFAIGLLMSMSVLLYTNKRDMRILLSLLYAEKANEADTENEIKMLIDIIDDYTEEKCIEFEDNKRTAMRLLQQSTIKSKTKLSYISNSNSNVLHQKNSKKKVNESNNNNIMSLNFINRVTKVTELLLYERISMAANDIYFLTADTKLYNSKTFSNYYNVDINIENNVIFDILKESEFAYLYYQSLQISKNIEEFMTKQKELIYYRK